MTFWGNRTGPVKSRLVCRKYGAADVGCFKAEKVLQSTEKTDRFLSHRIPQVQFELL